MRIITFFILFYATHGIAQKASSLPAIEQAVDNRKPDTAAQHHLNYILQLPPALTIVSCELLYNSSGELFKTSWSLYEPEKWAAMQAFMARAKSKDKLSFVNIYVMKGDKQMRLADKTILIP